ncbi:MAG: GntR family transcriptional regulator, partial [Candidatus Competibacterales bacterium]
VGNMYKDPALIQAGREAVHRGSMDAMIGADIAFHGFIYDLSENPLIAPAMENHWAYTHRVMGEVLLRDEQPRDIWNQHAAILDAIIAGDAPRAEVLVHQHIVQAADFMIQRLREKLTPTPGRPAAEVVENRADGGVRGGYPGGFPHRVRSLASSNSGGNSRLLVWLRMVACSPQATSSI